MPEPVRGALAPAKRAYLRYGPGPRLDQERWDKEWIAYFRRAPNYFDDFSTPNADSRRRVARVAAAVGTTFDGARGPVDESNPVWSIWAIGCHPAEISGRAVADLGCGAGGIGRTLGYVADSYLGIDYSPLALRVATLVSPPSCRYVLRSSRGELRRAAGSVDTAFSRSVFIHQNFDQAVELATLAAGLVKPGGVLAVDYRRPDTDEQGNHLEPPRSARSPLLRGFPSASYYFTDDEIAEVGDRAGLALDAIIEVPERSWRIARYRRT